MKTRTILTAIFIIALSVSCSSGKKQLEKGNYRTALEQALNRLQSSPNNNKARETLVKAYPMAIKYYRRQITHKIASNDPHKWEWVVSYYEDVNMMYEAIQKSPVALARIPQPVHYYEELPEAQVRAAEVRYQWGLNALAEGSKQEARIAYDHFQVAQKFVPGYLEVAEKMAEARELGTVKVMVDLVPISSRYYQVSADFFQDAIYQYLSDYEQSRFVDFVLMENASNYNSQWDQILKLKFEDFAVGQTHTLHKQKEVSRDSVIVGSVVLEDGSEQDVYNTVFATVNIFKKEIQSQGLVSLQLIEAESGAVIHRDEFPGTYSWYSEWGHFNGDKRALNKKQKRLCESREVPPPPPQDLFIEFTKPIHAQVTRRIGDLYRTL